MKLLTIQQINLIDVPGDAIIVNPALRIIEKRNDETKTNELTLFYTADTDGAIKVEVELSKEIDGERVNIRDISNSILAGLFSNRPKDMPDNVFSDIITAINIANGKIAEDEQRQRDAQNKITYSLISGQTIRSDIASMNWPVLVEHIDDMRATVRNFKGMIYALLTRETIPNNEGKDVNTIEWVKSTLDTQAAQSSFQCDYTMYDGKVSDKELQLVRVIDQMLIQSEILKATQMVMLQGDMQRHYEPIIEKLQSMLVPEEKAEPDAPEATEPAAEEPEAPKMPDNMDKAITSATAAVYEQITSAMDKAGDEESLNIMDVITQGAEDLPTEDGEVVSEGDLG